MSIVYLLGTCHEYQLGSRPLSGSSDEDFAEFRKLLHGYIESHAIRSVAEEMSLEALKKHLATGDSLPCLLAEELGLIHRYCDPDQATRKVRSIVTPQQREAYWIEQLRLIPIFPVLFIVGADHIESFARLLSESGFQPVKLENDWKPVSE